MRHTKVLVLFASVWMIWKVRIADGKVDSCKTSDNYNINKSLSDNDKSDCDKSVRGAGNSGTEEQNNLSSNQRSGLQADRRYSDRSIFDLVPDISIYAPSTSKIKNPLCRRDVEIVTDRIRHLDMWALKMLDSTGKMPSGLLNGNVNQFGDFDQCLSVKSPTEVGEAGVAFTGKYCLAYMDVKVINNHRMDELLHSYGALASNLSDPGHRVARFSTVSWGFCMPATCHARDLQQWVADTWSDNSDVTIQVKVEEEMCYTTEKEPYSIGKVLAFVFFFSILAMTTIGTFLAEDKNNNKSDASNVKESRLVQLLRAFSLKKNMATLFDTSTSPEDVTCLHGIRALNAICLLIFHKSAAIMFNPYVNRTAMTDSLGLAWSVIGRTAIIYTDSFILLSGLLTSYIFIKDLDKKGKISLRDKYWTRFFRITPNLVAVILFCTYVMVDLGSGPQWNLVVKHHADLCKANMWRNMFFIHNYFGFENMCLTHTHQLGIDMQLFLVSPLLVWLLWRHLKTGLTVVVTLGVLSTWLRYTVALNKQLSPVLYFGSSVTQMFDTANLSYILPTHRATVYLMGILTGFALRRIKTLHLNKFQVTLAYLVGVPLGLYAMCGPYHMARRDYEYSALEAANWNAFAPIMWSAMLCLGVMLLTHGYGGFLDSILSWRGFVVFTRIAYGVYLTQFPVYFYNVGSQRTPEFYSSFMLVNPGELGVIFAASIALTLLVDLPFQQIKHISWRSSPQKKIERAAKEAVQPSAAPDSPSKMGGCRQLKQHKSNTTQRGPHRLQTG